MGDLVEEYEKLKKENERELCKKRRRVKRCSECLRYYECFPYKYRSDKNEQK